MFGYEYMDRHINLDLYCKMIFEEYEKHYNRLMNDDISVVERYLNLVKPKTILQKICYVFDQGTNRKYCAAKNAFSEKIKRLDDIVLNNANSHSTNHFHNNM